MIIHPRSCWSRTSRKRRRSSWRARASLPRCTHFILTISFILFLPIFQRLIDSVKQKWKLRTRIHWEFFKSGFCHSWDSWQFSGVVTFPHKKAWNRQENKASQIINKTRFVRHPVRLSFIPSRFSYLSHLSTSALTFSHILLINSIPPSLLSHFSPF